MVGSKPAADRQRGTVVILTALELEFHAVCAYLRSYRHEMRGTTQYGVGHFDSPEGRWNVAVAAVGAGNPEAASETALAVERYHPDVVMFVGVAGGIKDAARGDVVAANVVAWYERGKAGRVFLPRGPAVKCSHELEQLARLVLREKRWRRRIRPKPERLPNALIGTIAAGEKVVADTRSAAARLIRDKHSGAVAVDMESYGFMAAAWAADDSKPAIVVRGISDCVDDKTPSSDVAWQPAAAANAAAFAFEMLHRRGEVAQQDAPVSDAKVPIEVSGHAVARRTDRAPRRPWLAVALDDQLFRVEARDHDVSRSLLVGDDPVYGRWPLPDGAASLAATQDGTAVAALSAGRLHIAEVRMDATFAPWGVSFEVPDGMLSVVSCRRDRSAAVHVLLVGDDRVTTMWVDPGGFRQPVDDACIAAADAAALGGGFLVIDRDGALRWGTLELNRLVPHLATPWLTERWSSVDSAEGGDTTLVAGISSSRRSSTVHAVRITADDSSYRTIDLRRPATRISVARTPITGEVPGALIVEVADGILVMTWDDLPDGPPDAVNPRSVQRAHAAPTRRAVRDSVPA